VRCTNASTYTHARTHTHTHTRHPRLHLTRGRYQRLLYTGLNVALLDIAWQSGAGDAGDAGAGDGELVMTIVGAGTGKRGRSPREMREVRIDGCNQLKPINVTGSWV
jgi:hypothetical protein